MIAKDDGGHCLHDRDSARKNTGIMAPARGEFGLLARGGYGFLFVRDRCGRLKRNPKINLFAVADSALDAPCVVCRCTDFPTAHFKWVVMLRAAHPRRHKPGTNLKSFCCR